MAPHGVSSSLRGGDAPRDLVWWWRRQLGGRCWEKEARASSISAPRRHGDRRRAVQLYHQHWSTSTVPGGPPGFTLTAPLDVTLDGREWLSSESHTCRHQAQGLQDVTVVVVQTARMHRSSLQLINNQGWCRLAGRCTASAPVAPAPRRMLA